MNQEELKQKKDEFIRKIIKDASDMKVHFIDQITGKKWISEKKITELTTDERNQFNLRKQFPFELILDIEDRNKMIDIRRKLEEKKWSYTEWLSGSRGIHCSIFFSNLEDKPVELRNRIRKYFISYFETDKALSIENQFIAQEYALHFKTGKPKELIDTINTGTENIIERDVIEYCEDELKKQEERKTETKQIIVNWKNDPYLNHALNNIIEGGNRNNILFKNLAILLVLAGLTREEILPYAQKIVSNCPRKNIGEFMGWVDKSMAGQLAEFNKSELQQWSVQRGEEALYKFESDEDIIKLLSIKQLWDAIWDSKIECQPIWRDLAFYNLLGTIVDEKDEDYRIHVIFSSDSTTGKDEGALIIQDILERMNYKIHTPSDVTDRTLVGAVNQKAYELNTQYGLTESNPIKGKHEWKNPVEKGILEDANWIAWNEAESVFKPGIYNKKLMLILRQSMDKRRTVEKGVGGFMVHIRTNTSFLLTTYTMNDVINAILHNGIFQRCLFYNKELAEGEDDKIMDKIIDYNFNTNSKNKFNREKYISILIEKLKEMRKWYNEHRKDFIFEEKSDEMIKKLVKKAKEDYSSYFIEDKEILNSMIRRYGNNLHKLTILNGVFNMNPFITHRQIKECFNLILLCIDGVKGMIMKQGKTKKRTYAILNYIAKGSVLKSVVYSEMQKNFRIKSTSTQKKLIDQLLASGYISSFKNGTKDMLYITSKGEDYLIGEE